MTKMVVKEAIGKGGREMSTRQKVESFLDRLERAEQILIEGRIHRVEGMEHVYVVRGTRPYLVNTQEMTCTCPDHTERGRTCKHILATVLLERAEQKERKERVQ